MKPLYTIFCLSFMATFNANAQLVTMHDRSEESVYRGETYHPVVRAAYEPQEGDEIKHVYTCTPLQAAGLATSEFEAHYREYAEYEPASDLGFQFETTPAQLDMMESVRNFELSRSGNQPPVTNVRRAPDETMVKILALSASDAATFLEVYQAYEQELANLVQKVDDVVTAAQREAILKEKYFDTLKNLGSSYLAYRFLAWVDYYAQTCAAKE